MFLDHQPRCDAGLFEQALMRAARAPPGSRSWVPASAGAIFWLSVWPVAIWNGTRADQDLEQQFAPGLLQLGGADADVLREVHADAVAQLLHLELAAVQLALQVPTGLRTWTSSPRPPSAALKLHPAAGPWPRTPSPSSPAPPSRSPAVLVLVRGVEVGLELLVLRHGGVVVLVQVGIFRLGHPAAHRGQRQRDQRGDGCRTSTYPLRDHGSSSGRRMGTWSRPRVA